MQPRLREWTFVRQCQSSGTVDLRDRLGGPISQEAGLLPEGETVT